MEHPDLVDEAVLLRAGAGDRAAITLVYRAYQPMLLRYLRGRLPDLATDLAAQTWLDAARNLSSFRGGPDDFRRWLLTIGRRRVQDELRRRGRRPQSSVAEPPEQAAADDPLDRQDGLDRALALVRRLPPDQADAVLLRIVADLDVGQVAEVLGRSEGSVRVLVHRGLKRLRELVETVTWSLL